MLRDKGTNKKIEAAKKMLAEYIKSNHLRNTDERSALLEAVFCVKSPFDAEDVRTELNKGLFKVSPATAYNNLLLLEKAKILTKIKVNQRVNKFTLTEREDSPNYLVCTQCGKVKPFNNAGLNRALKNLYFKRFNMERHSLYIYGICESCRIKLQESQKEK